jgi:hypothetical protein
MWASVKQSQVSSALSSTGPGGSRWKGRTTYRRRGRAARGVHADGEVVPDGRYCGARRRVRSWVRRRRGGLALGERRGSIHAHRLRARSSVEILQDGRGVNHIAGVTQTLIEPCCVVSRHVPLAAHHVVDVLAESGRARTILASAEAELRRGNKVLSRRPKLLRRLGVEQGKTYGPFVQLDELPCECIGEHKAANGVAWANQFSAGHTSHGRLYRSRRLRGDPVPHPHPRQEY